MAEAIAAVRALIARSDDGDAGAILEFQVAMLEDDALIAPAFARDRRGQGRRSGVARRRSRRRSPTTRMPADEYFRARAADLRDLRDRCSRNLSGDARLGAAGGRVIAADDVTPSRFLSVDWTRGGGDRALRRQPVEPCGHAGALARRADGRRPRRDRSRRPRFGDRRRRPAAASSSVPATGDWSTYAAARDAPGRSRPRRGRGGASCRR